MSSFLFFELLFSNCLVASALYIHFSVMDVRTSKFEVLFLMFCARVKISSSWG